MTDTPKEKDGSLLTPGEKRFLKISAAALLIGAPAIFTVVDLLRSGREAVVVALAESIAGRQPQVRWFPNGEKAEKELNELGVPRALALQYPVFTEQNTQVMTTGDVKRLIDLNITPEQAVDCSHIDPTVKGIITLVQNKVDCSGAYNHRTRFATQDFIIMKEDNISYEEGERYPLGFGGLHIRRIKGMQKSEKDIDSRFIGIFTADEIVLYMEEGISGDQVDQVLKIKAAWKGEISAVNIVKLLKANVPATFIQELPEKLQSNDQDYMVNKLSMFHKAGITIDWLKAMNTAWKGRNFYIEMYDNTLVEFKKSNVTVDTLKKIEELEKRNAYGYRDPYVILNFTSQINSGTSEADIKAFTQEGLPMSWALYFLANKKANYLPPAEVKAYYDATSNDTEPEMVAEYKKRGISSLMIAKFVLRSKSDSDILSLDDEGLVKDGRALTYPNDMEAGDIIKLARAGIDGAAAYQAEVCKKGTDEIMAAKPVGTTTPLAPATSTAPTVSTIPTTPVPPAKK